MTLPSPYFALRAADDRCTGMRVRFGAACTVERIELSGAEDNDRAKDVMAEWATSFRRLFGHLVLDSLEIELGGDEASPEVPDEAAPETVFRAYEQEILESYFKLFDNPQRRSDSFCLLAQFWCYPFAVGFGARAGRSLEHEVGQALRSWLRGVERFSLSMTVRRPSAHERIEFMRRLKQP